MAQIAIMAAVTAIEVGVSIYQMLNRPRTPVPPPALNQFSSSIAGTPIPFGYGTSRIPGTVIWSAGIVQKRVKQHAAHVFGIGFGTYYVYSYSASFAVAFCEGPAKIGRIWFDSKLVYDPNPNGAGNYPVVDFPAWNANVTYQPGNEVSYSGVVWQALLESTGQAPPGGGVPFNTYWEMVSDYPPYDSGVTYQAGQTVSYSGQIWVAVATANAGVYPGTNHLVWQLLSKYYPQPTIYSGDEAQGPDPLIQSVEGAARTGAERGLCYCVFENFPLANFGNRIPNVRAEVTFNDTSGPIIAAQTVVGYVDPAEPTVSLPNIEITDFLIAVCHFMPGSPNPTIQDDSGGANTWTPAVSQTNGGVWYCHAPAAAKELTVTFLQSGGGGYHAGGYLIRVTGWSSYSVGSNSGTAVGRQAMMVTNGSDSVTMTSQVSGVWAAALFALLDSMGHKLRICAFICEGDFTTTNGAALAFPAGFTDLFPTAEGAPSVSTVMYDANPTMTLDQALTDICERAGLASTDLDTSLLTSVNVVPTNQVYGYVVRENRTAVEAIRALTSAYFFDAVESSGKLRFVPRGLAPAMTIPEADLGLLEELAKLLEQISQEQDLPYLATIMYEDPTLDYQQGKQEKQRNARIIDTKNQITINAPLVLTPDMARQVAEKALFIAWLERDTYDPLSLGSPKYLVLDPADVVQFIYEGITFAMRITEQQAGQNFALRLKGATDSADAYSSVASGGVAQSPVSGQPSRPALTGAIALWLLDIPLVADTDSDPGYTGFYWAIGTSQADFSGATLQESTDNTNFEDLAAAGSLVDFGFTTNSLANPSAAPFTPGSFVWDNTNTITVFMASGSLASASDADVENGANALLVGNATNGYEILRFGTAVQNADGSYTLSHLLRGLRGTEWMCGFWGDFSNGVSKHAVDDLVLVVDSGVQRQPEPLAIISATRYYRAPQAGTDPTTAASQEFTDAANDLKPYAPIEVGAEFDSSQNCIITWQRRTRVGGDNWGNAITGQSFPLSEDSETYDVEILNAAGTSVLRTISSLKSSTAIYTQAQQVADFGSVQTTYKVNVYQRSAQAGRGFKGHGTVGTGIIAPEVLSGGGFYVNGS